MSGSAFGRVLVSSLVKGVFPDGQQTRYHLYYIIDQRTLLGTCYIFPASLPLQYVSVCICINKRGLHDVCITLGFYPVQQSVFLFNTT